MTAPQTARRGRPGYSREQVLQIAVALFNEQGYDATSVSDLATRLGLTKSALYHHFDSKEQLLELALDSALGGLEGALDAAMEHDAVAEQLNEAIRGAVRVLTAQQPQVTLLLRLRGNSPVELAALQRRRAFDQRLSSLVRRAQHEGLLRDDIGAGTITRLIFGMINSIVEWYRADGAIDPQGLADDVLSVAIDGLRRPTAR
ncbi:TetR/AcrR family transcriptional regulator [Microbacterium bovistercoris]|uniref:TetR/AcrR family transcriptional regulator n=1 Tax=Microbacterium bovistercoris TaxID=2293570 RepID=A0A371NUT9_9MICO|nr:TetR/AcrR family transcriptional regulator [Microbacterium bovistercoris]REJ06060.1 TetR/AcrR family transcriptional regulator [Microbacterium bovistercoris]